MTNGTLKRRSSQGCDARAAMTDEERFCCEITAVQNVLLSFVMSLVRDQHLARDVVQETNLVLWRKRDEFQPDLPFRPWALRIAYLQTLAVQKASRRSKLVFDHELVLKLATDAEDVLDQVDQRYLRLQACVSKLVGRQSEVIRRRYGRSQSISDIARDFGSSVAAVGMLLHRARLALIECMQMEGATS
jgi:RNA polymerase sigma-70 factor, ECF subfamily